MGWFWALPDQPVYFSRLRTAGWFDEAMKRWRGFSPRFLLRRQRMRALWLPPALTAGVLALSGGACAAELKQKTSDAFNQYVAASEKRMAGELKEGGAFLYPDRPSAGSDSWRREAYSRLKNGEILVERQETSLNGKDLDVPEGMVHHWVGLLFIPGANLQQTVAVAQDYDNRAQLYKPEVIASRTISHHGDDYQIFLRLYEKRFTTVAFNTEYAIHWGQVDSKKVYCNSFSTRITQIKDPSHPDDEEFPVGEGSGYLWRLNTYWRFQEKDGGVYVQLEAVSLTRDIPFGLGWLLRPLVTKIPRQSLTRALGRTREVVLERMAANR